MKKTVIAIALLSLMGRSIGQEIKKELKNDRTVFGSSNSLGGFIGFTSKVGDINGQTSLMVGGQISGVFSSKFNIGFAGYGLTTNVDSDTYDEKGELYELHMGYGGLLIEPVIASKSMVHITVPIFLGLGGAGTHRQFNHPLTSDEIENFEKKYEFETDVILVAEPGLNIEVNLLKNVRLDLGASYRYVYDSNVKGINDQELSGISGNVSLKFGWF